MKKVLIIFFSGFTVYLFLAGFRPAEPIVPTTDQYIMIAWNDLGMHCANLDFSNMCILPPYNNQLVHVIRKGDATRPPLVVNGTAGIYVTYEIPGNSYSAGKTNFWSYTQHLFGVVLQPNIGLTGNGMTGTLVKNDALNYQIVTGIPNTAFPDATPLISSPYQLTLMKAWSPAGVLLATTQSVIPVSHEINCVSAGCHASELAILQKHDQVPGFNIADKPILCASCHSDNALGTPGQQGVPPFSQAIHEKHGGFINTGTIADCYKCHPGPNTQCWRDIMHTTSGLITKCQDCHGSVEWVGHSIDEGREPWLEQPSCGAANCHGPQYAEEPGKLFRESKGHGGLFCSTCHNSPHAILPSTLAADNLQNLNLQGFSGTLSQCSVCHGYTPAGNGPHGIPAIQPVQNVTITSGQSSCYNATQVITVAGNGSSFVMLPGSNATFISGKTISFLPGTLVQPGGHLKGYITSKGRYCNNPLPPFAPLAMASEENDASNQDLSALFKVYPNPSSRYVTIEFEPRHKGNPSVIKIFDTYGQEIFSTKIQIQAAITIPLQDQSDGMYIISVTSQERTVFQKIIKLKE